MGLRDHEQRELDEIEQRLAEDDPRFAAKLANTAPSIFRASRRTQVVLGVLAIYVLGLGIIVAGVTISSSVLIVLGSAVTASVFAGLTGRAWRDHRR